MDFAQSALGVVAAATVLASLWVSQCHPDRARFCYLASSCHGPKIHDVV
jgi:hypothetical protein